MKLRKSISACALFLWGITVLVFYYRNWSSQLALVGVGRYLLSDIGTVLLLLLAFFAAGKKLTHILHLQSGHIPEEILTPIALGMSTYLILTMLLGFAGILYDWLLFLFILLGIVTNLRDTIGLFHRSWHGLKKFLGQKIPTADFVLFLFPLSLLVLIFILTLAPPLGPDDLIYHLNAPRRFLQNHNISLSPETKNSTGMQYCQMLYTLCLTSGRDIAAKMMNFCILLFLLGTLKQIARRFFPQIRMGLVWLLLLSQPIVFYVGVRAYGDLFATWMTLMAIYYVLVSLEENKRRGFFLSAVFIGMAVGAKLTSAYAIISISFVILIASIIKRRAFAKIIGDFASYYVIIFLIILGWLLWNWHYLGTPLYPFLREVFSPGREFILNDTFLSGVSRSLKFATNLKQYLLLPFTVTFTRQPPNGYWGNIILPGFLCLLPLILWACWKNKIRIYLVIYSAVYIILWSWKMQFIRYLLPIIPVLAILGVDALNEMRVSIGGRSGKAIYVICVALFIYIPATLFLFVKTLDYQNVKALQFAANFISRDTFYRGTYFSPMYRMSEYCNKTLDPKASRIRMFWEAQSYYLNIPYIPDSLTHSDLYELQKKYGGDTQAVCDALRSQGITHILYNRGCFADLFSSSDAIYGKSQEIRQKAQESNLFFQRFAKDYLKLEHRERFIELYRWKR